MAKAPKRQRGSTAGEVYRLSRMLHAYLSAFAFLALIFFSVTGLTLNHPEWLAGRRPAERVNNITLPAPELAQARKAAEPERALALAVGRHTKVVGGYSGGETLDGQALLRFEGPGGSSDVTVTLATGETEVAVRPATTISMLNDLHKGKATGAPWRLLIDAFAVLFIVMSVLGYVLFFSLRFRLPLSLVLTGVSLVVLVAAAIFLVA